MNTMTIIIRIDKAEGQEWNRLLDMNQVDFDEEGSYNTRRV